MSDVPIAIRATDLSKRFKLYSNPNLRLLEWACLGRIRRHQSHWALRNIDLTVHKGECLGIVGGNGSGKSTLVKILSSALYPTTGTIMTAGRVLALIELGTGFNGWLTGRQNIGFAGAMLGLDGDYVASKTDSIIKFADLGDYIDQPARFYSSGMYARLGLSLFAFLEPDVLLIDEALSVGDQAFQDKCNERIQMMVSDEQRSAIIVTHSLGHLQQYCHRAMWLEHGQIRMTGNPAEVAEAYSYAMSHAPPPPVSIS